jgi:hypothetical protein
MTKKRPKKQTRALIGRPTVMTDEVIRKLEEAFMMDATDGEACAFAGIGETAYYDEKKRNPEFADRIHRAQQFPFMLAKKTVLNAMKDDDGALALKWLKNRQRDRYHEKVEQEVKGTLDDLIRQQEASTPPDANPGS